jgi:hypothetical protein
MPVCFDSLFWDRLAAPENVQTQTITKPELQKPQCFECEQPAEANHHVVPKSRGGTKTVALCTACHAKAHHRDKNMASATLTKQALAAAKARGVLLGASRPECRSLTDEARKRGSHNAGLSHARRADDAYAALLPNILAWHNNGLSLRTIANRLNADGHTTRSGLPWNPSQVWRVLQRANR